MLLALCAVVFTACSDDDEIEDTSIAGSWEETSNIDGTWVWTFNKNGKGNCQVTDKNNSYSFSFSFKFDGRTLIISGKEDGKAYTDKYSVKFIDQDMILLTDDNGLKIIMNRKNKSNNVGNKEMPQLSPNNTNISVEAKGGSKTLTVSNAKELNITQINNKTKGANNTSTDTDVQSVSNGKIKDPKNVDGGWFSAKVDGNKIVFTVTENTDTQNSRDKYIHVSCGGNIYGLSLHLVQDKAAESK